MTRPRDYSADFHDFDGAIYANCAFHGAMPRVATEAVEEALRLKKTPHLIRDEHHFAFPDAYRAAVAELIGARESDVAVANSATQGTMILVSGLDWRPGDEVVSPTGEFPSNRIPWHSLGEKGVVVREVALASPDRALESLEAVVTERTRVVSVSWISYATGARLDLARIGALCRERGALLAVDASQGIGALRFSVEDAPIDLVTCAGYKWMLGPYSTGFAWVRPGLAEELRPGNVNWFSLAGARDFNRLSECELVYEPGARRFDMNEPGNFFNMAGAAASVRYLLDVGLDAVERHILALQDRLIDGLPEGMRSLAPTGESERSNILCIGMDPPLRGEDVFEHLLRHRVYLSRREGALRVSPHLFNTAEQIDRLLELMRDAVGGESADGGAIATAGRAPVRGEPIEPERTARALVHDVLEGRFVRLRPIRPEADAAALYPGSHQPESAPALWAYLPYGPFESVERMAEWLEACSAGADPRFYVVERRDAGRPVGMASFQRVNLSMRVIELAHIWYLPEAQRTEANTETVYLMLREAFDELGFRRAEWKCDALNTPSRRAAVRLGFTFEGIFRQHMIVKGRNRDTAWYAMLDHQWPRVRANLERWLQADADARPSLGSLSP